MNSSQKLLCNTLVGLPWTGNGSAASLSCQRQKTDLSSFLISRAGGTASASTAEGEEDTDNNSASAITRLRVCVKVLATLKCSTIDITE